MTPAEQTDTAQPDMNLEPLETFVTDMALVLAGTVTQSDEAEGLSAQQLGQVFFASVAAHAKTRPDYNPETDIAPVIQLGVAVYGEAVYATVAASLARAEAQLTGESASDEPAA